MRISDIVYIHMKRINVREYRQKNNKRSLPKKSFRSKSLLLASEDVRESGRGAKMVKVNTVARQSILMNDNWWQEIGLNWLIVSMVSDEFYVKKYVCKVQKNLASQLQ